MGTPTRCAITASRPRCDIPSTTCTASCSAAQSSISASSGISAATPSIENRFVPRYRAWSVCSNVSARTSRSNTIARSTAGASPSNRSAIHRRRSPSGMCMNSTPIVPQ